MRLSFGISSYNRARGDMPELPVINMYAEEAPTEEGGITLQSRPGLSDRSANMGVGPVEGLFKANGVLSGALFGVSDGALYSGVTSLGVIDGTGPVSMAGYETFLFTTAGASLWGYDGTTLAAIAFPDSANVLAVAVGASRLLAVRADTQKFYWSDALGTTIDALNFASSESSPDRLLDVLFIDDTAILFGAETIEFWPNTSDDNLPFQPLEGRVIEKGIKATGACCALGPTFAWVTNENKVCIGSEQNAVSKPDLQARIEASSECRLFAFTIEGQEYLALRIDSETQVYANGMWSEFRSSGRTNWIVQCHAGGVFGSSVDGVTLEWGSAHEDVGGELERRFRAGRPINSGGVIINNIQLRTNPGNTPYLTGDYTDPTVEVRFSRDAGKTWGSWKAKSLGAMGEYRKRVQWRGCGMASYPALLAEFRVTDPVPFRVSDVLVNEPIGGR